VALKTYKPTTNSLRGTVLIDRSNLFRGRPLGLLTKYIKKSNGRNNQGKITVRHRGGGVKNLYRVIDFKRNKFDIPGKIERIEYDPNRTAFIALVTYADGEKKYIIAPDGIKPGDTIISSTSDIDIQVGNALPLKYIPQGTYVHAVELIPGSGAVFARSAGSSVQVMGGDKGYIQLKMPSGELRLVKETCMATIGVVSNLDNINVKLGKAGRKRKLGIRPTVRGVAMSYKHPHGGGQGKGGRHGTGGPKKDRWGNLIGKRTRKNRKVSSKYIVQRRKEVNSFKKYKTVLDKVNK